MRRTRLVLAMLAASLTLSACDFDVYQLPLPGGTDTGDDPIVVTAQFRDVLDLVPKSTVKLNEIDVGKVLDVELDGTVAEVTMELRGDTELPDAPLAEIRQTSLLGEKFVSLSAPADGGSGELGDGDVIGDVIGPGDLWNDVKTTGKKGAYVRVGDTPGHAVHARARGRSTPSTSTSAQPRQIGRSTRTIRCSRSNTCWRASPGSEA